jgi:alpha-tubulin suppressor-like RCC1 family protein
VLGCLDFNKNYWQVYCWGQNTSGQVGCGSTANQPIPRRVSAVIGNSKIVYIACGQTSTFAASDTGEVVTNNDISARIVLHWCQILIY